MTTSLLIRGGTVVDGTGAAPREADVEVIDGRIARVAPAGSIGSAGHEVQDARGLLVTPGFVDPHSHYDGHVMWDDSLAPSSLHGVTTTVMGNCSVGFAPCKPEHRELLIELMESIEDIPGTVLKAALDWQWTTFPEYLDVLAQRRFDIDVAAQLPHAALRVNVMGERAVRREAATAADRAAMGEQMRAALRAGALGFSSSRIRAHKTKTGDFTPDYQCAEDELMALALALKAEGKGVLQFVTDISDQKEEGVAEFGILRRLVEASGRPLSMNITQREADPDGWRRLMRMIGEANAAGAVMKGQVLGRGIGLVLGFELTDNPFSGRPAYQALAHLPFAERARLLAEPAVRRRILDDTGWDPRKNARIAEYERTWELGADQNYEPAAQGSIAARAARLGIPPAELAYDLMLQNGARGMLYRPVLNYAHGSLDDVYDMLTDPHGVPGIADGGAHCGMTCDAAITTFNLAYWTRDRTRGPRLPLERMVRGLTSDAAAMLGFADRGRIAPGLRADLNVIDYDRLGTLPAEVAYDMPAGGRRLVQRARGYVATYVAGVAILRDDQPTGARPGRLIRA